MRALLFVVLSLFVVGCGPSKDELKSSYRYTFVGHAVGCRYWDNGYISVTFTQHGDGNIQSATSQISCGFWNSSTYWVITRDGWENIVAARPYQGGL